MELRYYLKSNNKKKININLQPICKFIINETSTKLKISTSANYLSHQHIKLSAHQHIIYHISTSNYQHIKLSAHQHIDTSAHHIYCNLTHTFFASVKNRRASQPPSRPTPLCLTPPNGVRKSRNIQQFTQTMPVFNLAASECARVTLLVHTENAKPYVVLFAKSMAS